MVDEMPASDGQNRRAGYGARRGQRSLWRVFPVSVSNGLSRHGLFAVLAASAVTLMDTALVSSGMPELTLAFAARAQTEPFAVAMMQFLSIFPGEPDAAFLIKFVLLSNTALFILIGSPFMGWICDRWGRKRLLILSLIGFVISGTATYFADSVLYLFAARSLLGLMIAGLKTTTVAIVGDTYRGAARNKVIGWQGAAFKMTGVAFLLLGGFLADLYWRVPYLGYLLALLIVPSALIALRETRPSTSRPAAGCVDGPGEAPPDLPFVPCAIVFISAVLGSGFFFITLVQLPFFLGENFAARPFQMGAAIAVGNTVGGITALFYGRIRARLNYAGIYALNFLSLAVGYYVLTLAPSYSIALVGMLIAGVGFGLYIPNQSSWIMAVVSEKRRGFGVGLATAGMFVGQFFAPIIVQPFIQVGNPKSVWTAVSQILFILVLCYGLLSAFYARLEVRAARPTAILAHKSK